MKAYYIHAHMRKAKEQEQRSARLRPITGAPRRWPPCPAIIPSAKHLLERTNCRFDGCHYRDLYDRLRTTLRRQRSVPLRLSLSPSRSRLQVFARCLFFFDLTCSFFFSLSCLLQPMGVCLRKLLTRGTRLRSRGWLYEVLDFASLIYRSFLRRLWYIIYANNSSCIWKSLFMYSLFCANVIVIRLWKEALQRVIKKRLNYNSHIHDRHRLSAIYQNIQSCLV